MGRERRALAGSNQLLSGSGDGNLTSTAVQYRPTHASLLRSKPVIHNPRLERQLCLSRLEPATYDAVAIAQMQPVRLREPDMAINARPLVKPAIAIGGIDSDHDEILAAVIQEVTHIGLERHVAGVVAAQVAAVQEHGCAAKHAVELENDAPIRVRGRDIESASIPSDRGFPVVAAEWLVTVALKRLVTYERQ